MTNDEVARNRDCTQVGWAGREKTRHGTTGTEGRCPREWILPPSPCPFQVLSRRISDEEESRAFRLQARPMAPPAVRHVPYDYLTHAQPIGTDSTRGVLATGASVVSLPANISNGLRRSCSLPGVRRAERDDGRHPVPARLRHACAGVVSDSILSTGVSSPPAPLRQYHHLTKRGSTLTHFARLRARHL